MSEYNGTPETLFTIPGNVEPGYPLDAIECALSRADATLLLLSGQFDGAGAERLADDAIGNVLWAVRGEIGLLKKMVAHGYKTERGKGKRADA